MSIVCMNHVWKADLPRDEKIVLLAIADHVDDNGEGCWASYERLAYKTGYTRRHTIRIVAKLEAKGIIVHMGEHRRHGTNIWRIALDKIPMQLPFNQWRRKVQARQPVQVRPARPRVRVDDDLDPPCPACRYLFRALDAMSLDVGSEDPLDDDDDAFF